MELEGNLSLERVHTRRWVSIVGIVIPVAAFVSLAVWFIRAYIVPPTITIPAPMLIADVPPAPVVAPVRDQPEAVQPQVATPAPPVPEPAIPAPARERTETAPLPTPAVPMFSALAVVPAASASAPPAYVNAAQDAPLAASPPVNRPPAAPEASAPIAGPIPLPRPRPRVRVAHSASVVPLPLPRPAESAPPAAEPAPALPAFDRHQRVE
jgi:hypothetical protein